MTAAVIAGMEVRRRVVADQVDGGHRVTAAFDRQNPAVARLGRVADRSAMLRVSGVSRALSRPTHSPSMAVYAGSRLFLPALNWATTHWRRRLAFLLGATRESVSSSRRDLPVPRCCGCQGCLAPCPGQLTARPWPSMQAAGSSYQPLIGRRRIGGVGWLYLLGATRESVSSSRR